MLEIKKNKRMPETKLKLTETTTKHQLQDTRVRVKSRCREWRSCDVVVSVAELEAAGSSLV